MGSFGERMRREREMRGVTLEEIAESTKIGTRSLRALEAEDFDKLPGGIFNKGFVRAYARYLGIDEEQAVADFTAAYGDHQVQLPQPPEGEVKQEEQREKSLNLLAVAGAVVVLAVLFLIWGFHERIGGAAGRLVQRFHHAPAAQAPVTVAVAPAPTPANPPATAQQTPASDTAPANPNTGGSAPATKQSPSAAPENPAATPVKDPAAKPALTAAADRTNASPEVASAAREFVLVVRARQDAWVKIKADDQLLMEGTLKGEKTVHARQKVVFTTGNAGAIELSFNGEPQPVLGDDNQVKTVVFTPDGRLR